MLVIFGIETNEKFNFWSPSIAEKASEHRTSNIPKYLQLFFFNFPHFLPSKRANTKGGKEESRIVFVYPPKGNSKGSELTKKNDRRTDNTNKQTNKQTKSERQRKNQISNQTNRKIHKTNNKTNKSANKQLLLSRQEVV